MVNCLVFANALPLLNQFVSGLSIVGILLLTALGLAITFGVMRIINLAHGEFITVGAYSSLLVQDALGLDLVMSIPISFLIAGLVGAITEVSVIRRLYGRPLETLLATWGLSIVLRGVIRLLFGAQQQYVQSPPYLSGSVTLLSVEDSSDITLSYYRLFIIGIALALLFLTALLLYGTGLGRKMRAVTQNRQMAECLGVNTKLVDLLTFAYGCGLAGIAGTVMSAFSTVAPEMGQNYLLDSWMVVVAGGVDQLFGTLAGAILIGEGNAMIAYFTNDPTARVIILLGVIVLIRYRPEGLFTVQKRS
ncbi:urea ABC transporter permease subunit UrtB [Euhalothece natronophila]|uniref:urea ABC transporter permease subunit UrtB n=1 Tax=Euhalothece natronophila TaxID=577489 RepID=UPI001FE537C9|nr:urea ABC transporter permease subunit UrtB [Euhalothece natronophila]